MLEGFFISRFRSFGEEEQLVFPLNKVNVFIGQNNSGKSNVLRFIRDIISPLYSTGNDQQRRVPAISTPQFPHASRPTRPILVNVSDAAITAAFEGRIPRFGNWQEFFASHPHLVPGTEHAQIETERDGGRLRVTQSALGGNGVNHQVAQSIWSSMHPSAGGGSFTDWHPGIFSRLIQLQLHELDTVYIPSFRQINTRLDEFSDEYILSTGEAHLIDELSELAYPSYESQSRKLRFEKLRRFIGEVTNRPAVQIEIPHNRKTINVKTDDTFVPLEALGSGIHQLFMLAAKIVINERKTILLEEPEAHMHPGLQRKFMDFLAREIDSQFFVTTHSAQIIDTAGACVFGVTSKAGVSTVKSLLTKQSKRSMCAEIGYKASDLLQSNCVIWVEGPSDRVYLLYWLSHLSCDLKEGIHFSIMFYGGKLLSHISAEDAEFSDFIGLLPINRYPAVMIDSDRGADNSPLRAAKVRVIDELDKVGGHHWVTAGREIENYIPHGQRERAVKAVYPKADRLSGSRSRYGKPLDYIDDAGRAVTSGYDKIRIARKITSYELDTSCFDLLSRLQSLVEFIRSANR